MKPKKIKSDVKNRINRNPRQTLVIMFSLVFLAGFIHVYNGYIIKPEKPIAKTSELLNRQLEVVTNGLPEQRASFDDYITTKEDLDQLEILNTEYEKILRESPNDTAKLNQLVLKFDKLLKR